MPSLSRGVIVLMVAALIAAAIAPSAGARERTPTRIDRAEECNQVAPESARVWTGSGTGITLAVDVLLDEVPRADAQAIFASAAESYSPLNITLTPTFRKASFDPSTTRAEALIEAARAFSGGARTTGFDIVYVLTGKDISIASGDVVGYADCIGGIRYPNRAFAVGEATEEVENTGGINFYADGPAKTAAHEIGHLLGGRHDHANCLEGISPNDLNGREATPCTLMTTYLDFQSSNFGTLESSIVRYYAETYAAP